MFERFTDRARRAIVLAQEEARALGHGYIGTEHILLGLVGEGAGVAAQALEAMGVSLDKVRNEVAAVIGRGPDPARTHIPFTPRAKKVLELSLREAVQLGHNYIGTEHIVLGLIREGEGVAAQVLVALGADLAEVRTRVVHVLQGYKSARIAAGAETFVPPGATAEATEPTCPSCSARMSDHARYRVQDVSEESGSGVARVLFLFCNCCGRTLETLIVPEDA